MIDTSTLEDILEKFKPFCKKLAEKDGGNQQGQSEIKPFAFVFSNKGRFSILDDP